MELRKSYVETLSQLMKQNDKITVLDADLAGAGGTKPLYKEFPERCIECGIAEANMACIAAGLSAGGYIPFIHSFAPFSSRRIFDQIAVSVSYSEQNVKIIGWDPGVTTTTNGGTHMCFEDVAMMRALSNVAVLDIVDDVQIAKALPSIVEHNGSVYVRMERKGSQSFYGEDYKFTFGKADKLRDGKDITVIASGALLYDAREAVERLDAEGIHADFLAIHTIKPLDEAAILASAKKTGRVLVVENHSIHGGLYGAVCETLSEKLPTLCDAVAVRDRITQVGSLKDLKRDYNLTADDIVVKAHKLLGK
ncbi:MAG: transketolase family protein [Corallococcus sp.]|nr:transketolase family protein [Corallococcus sp.]MCM1359920.1 transketolase family protein [Corallococcus sp.]MCM1395476.1 transketolase family protein [Corallococcus sp.]